jgi:dUTP pyrophosphatase
MNEYENEALNIYRELRDALAAGHPGAAYLPWFYRSTPPYIFLFAGEARALLGRYEIDSWSGRAAIFLENGYRYHKRSRYRMTYRFPQGRDFTTEVMGGEMSKEIAGEEAWRGELELFYRKLGYFCLAPLLEMEEIKETAAVEQSGPPLRIKRLAEGLPLPAYAHAGDAGMDLCSAEELTIAPGGFALVSAGFAMALPEGYAAFIQPRSGLAAKHGISIVNTPGLIDCHYRGEVKIILINHGREAFSISRGDRIAQMVIQRVENARVEVVEELDETDRGAGGFGSTGL